MLKKNILYNFIYQLLIMILPFITAPYLSRVVGAEGIGVYSYSYSIASYFLYIAALGISNYGNRTIAGVRDDKEKRSKVFSEIYIMQLATGLISIVMYLIYICFISQEKVSAVCQLALVVSSVFDINWFFFGMEKFKLTVIRNTCIKILTVGVIFIFVKSQADVYKYILIMSVGTLVSQIILWPFIKKYIKFKIPQIKDVVKHFKPNIILFIPVIAVSIYKIMDKIMLGQISSMESVGYYENAERLINVPISLITAIGIVMLPKISGYIAKGKEEDSKKYFDLFMLIIIIFSNGAVFGLIGISDEFVTIFYGEGFELTSMLLKYLSVTIIFLAVGNVLRTQYLIPKKKDDIYIKSAIIGAISNLIVNIILIPKLNAIGAAIGTIFAELLVCAYQFTSSKNDIKIIKYIKLELVFSVVGYIMFIVIRLIHNPSNNIIILGEKIIVGLLIYSIISYFIIIKNICGTKEILANNNAVYEI